MASTASVAPPICRVLRGGSCAHRYNAKESIRLSPAERRQRVEVGVKAGKSNRAIGTELGVDEGTVRRDRKYLATPEDERPVRVPRPDTHQLPEPVKSPDELLSLTRPTYAVEEYMPAKLGFYAEWLARWLSCCLPREEELQDELLRQISIQARS